MICVILAAGYATRLYPLTKNFPKPLLKVGDKTILDWLTDDIASSGQISRFVVISNHRFAPQFEAWAETKPYEVAVVDDGTSTNETRLGAVKDLWLAIESLGLSEDLLVIAGDNVLDFSMKKFISYAAGKNTSCVMRYFEPSEEKLKKCGVLSVDEADRILGMVEKPENPPSHWCCPPFYFYKKEDVSRLPQAMEEGCKTDAPGSFVAWLCEKKQMHAMEMPGSRYDIGNLESYEQVKQNYHGIEDEK